MNYFKVLTLAFFLLQMSSCDFGTSSTTETPSTGNSITDKTEQPTVGKIENDNNWIVIPDEKVGRIQADFSGADIHKTFGDVNIRKTEIGLGEGETAMGMIVFPKTKNELQILFEDEKKMDKIASIEIRGEGSMWKTEEGIQIGTTLDELIKLNGKDFKFYGFEWDYAGRLADWDGGKLSENLSVDLYPTNEEAIFPDLLGDAEFSSNLPKAKAANLKVVSMTVKF